MVVQINLRQIRAWVGGWKSGTTNTTMPASFSNPAVTVYLEMRNYDK